MNVTVTRETPEEPVSDEQQAEVDRFVETADILEKYNPDVNFGELVNYAQQYNKPLHEAHKLLNGNKTDFKPLFNKENIHLISNEKKAKEVDRQVEENAKRAKEWLANPPVEKEPEPKAAPTLKPWQELNDRGEVKIKPQEKGVDFKKRLNEYLEYKERLNIAGGDKE